jgi:Fe2+ or Zn2+ uptake regulation protein
MMQPLSDTAPIASPPTLTQQDIERLLVQHGYRLTRPRAAVVNAMLQYSQPFTAEQLVADMGAVGGGIGRATIYRTLEILAAVDVLTRIIQPDGHPAYVCDSIGHRHHIVCSSCGKAVAFTFCPLDDLVPSLARDTSFEIHDHLLEVFGTCPTCQVSPASPS